MKFTIDNQTTGSTSPQYQYSDDRIYWTILGRKVADGPFFHMDATGAMIEISTNDNTNTVPGYPPASGPYANYSNKLSENPLPSFTDQVVSGRLYISLAPENPSATDGPLWVKVLSPTAYAEPSPTNPSVAGYFTIYDKIEFTFQPGVSPKLNCNTTCVDFLGIPINMTVGGKTVGFNANRVAIIKALQTCADSQFASLVIPGKEATDNDLRILSPANVMTTILPQPVYDYFSNYFQQYIDDTWNKYKSQPLTLTIYDIQYTGQVQTITVTLVTPQPDNKPPIEEPKQVDAFLFSQGSAFDPSSVICTIPKPGTVGDAYGDSGTMFLKSPIPPGTMAVLGCNNVLAFGNATMKNIQKFIAAGMNRTVTNFVEPGPSNWCDQSAVYYSNSPIEYYAKLLHDNSLPDGATPRCYAFSYDDVCDQSSSLTSDDADVEVTLDLPAWD